MNVRIGKIIKRIAVVPVDVLALWLGAAPGDRPSEQVPLPVAVIVLLLEATIVVLLGIAVRGSIH